jgi:hypothetical protein
VRALGFTNDERLAYIDLVGGSSAGFETEMDHRLLGYPYTLELSRWSQKLCGGVVGPPMPEWAR